MPWSRRELNWVPSNIVGMVAPYYPDLFDDDQGELLVCQQAAVAILTPVEVSAGMERKRRHKKSMASYRQRGEKAYWKGRLRRLDLEKCGFWNERNLILDRLDVLRTEND